MIKLYSFGPAFNVIDPSPFVFKIDTYLRMAGIEFESISDANNLGKAPKGKLPFITDGDKTVADSQFIIAYLQETYNVDLDSHLTDEQKGFAHLVGKSLDENLYWCLVHSRWADENNWPIVKSTFFDSMPFPLKVIVPIVARKDVLSSLKKHGMGKHSAEEIQQIAHQSFDALAAILGDKPYFFGDKPCTFDATAFAFLSEFIHTSLEHPINSLAQKHENLVQYCDRMKAEYYS